MGKVPLVRSTSDAPTRGGSAPLAVAASNNSSAFSGVWNTTEGVVFQFTQTAGSSSVTTSVLNDSCTGGPRTEFIQGSIQNETNLTGTMYRCSPSNSTLDHNCGLDAVWSTPFNATITNGDLINGTYQGQFWVWNVTSNGTWTNCHIQHYYNATFYIDRMDCGLQSFDQLGNKYISNPTLRAQDVSFANQLEAAAIAHASNPQAVAPVVWSAAQSVPGGFKSQVLAFQRELLSHHVSSHIESAYRPITYQAHLADIKHCALAMYQHAQSAPGDVKYLAVPVAALNYQVVHVHQFKNFIKHQVGSQEFDVPNRVCSSPPFTQCDHVDGLAVDMSVSGSMATVTADSIGAEDHFCRPLPADDPVHWVYRPGSVIFSGSDCYSSPFNELTWVGHSPINLLVTSPSGERIGFDPSTDAIVNDYGPGRATYSGPGTEPQVINIPSNATEPGTYSVSGIGTGSGPYTITYSVDDPYDTSVGTDGGSLYTQNQTGMASPGTELTPVTFPLRVNYSIPSPWSVGVPGSSGSGLTLYTLTTPNGSFAPSASSSTVDALMFSPSWGAIDLQPTSIGGVTSVKIPHALLLGPYTVWANASTLPSTTSDSGSFSTVTFQMPTNATVVTIQGTVPSPGPSGSSSFPWLDLTVVAIVAAAGITLGVAFLVRRRRGGQLPPSPLPPPPPPPRNM